MYTSFVLVLFAHVCRRGYLLYLVTTAMRKEQDIMIEEMQAWDNDPIWRTYEEEANKVTWEINQKCESV
jgi:hypothetical protein